MFDHHRLLIRTAVRTSHRLAPFIKQSSWKSHPAVLLVDIDKAVRYAEFQVSMTPATSETDKHPSGRKPIVELLQEALDTPLPSLDPVSQTTSPIASITSHPQASSKSSFARTNDDGLKSPPIAHFEDHHHYTAQRSASKTATAPEPHPNTYKHCELALDNNNNNTSKDQSSSDSMAVFRPGATPTLLQTLNKARPSISNVKRQPQVLMSHQDQVLGRRSPNAVGHDTPSSLRGMGTRNDGGQDQGNASTPYMQAEATRAALHELEDRAEQSTVAEKYLPAFIQPSNWEMQNVNPFTNLLTSNPFSKLGESSNQGTPTGTSPRPSLRRRRNHRSNSASLLETVSRETQPTVASMLDYDANRSDASCSHTHGRKTSFGARPRPASMEALRAASPTPTSWFDGPALFPRPPTPAFGNSSRSFHSASKRSAPSLWKWFDGGGSSSKSSSGKHLQGSEAAETPQRDASAKKHAHKHMLDESDKRDSVEKEEEHIKRKYSAPKNPVVFCHGLLGFDYIGPKGLPALQISHWRGILEVLQENGVELMIAKVPATSSAAQRAEILVKAIEEKFAGRQVNLVGHSMVSS